MKPFWRWTGLVLLALGLLVIAALVAALVNLADLVSSPDMLITVDDQTVHLAGLSGGGWLLALGGIALAVLIVLVVVPLALLFGLGLPLLLCAGALVLALLVAGTALVAVASPFIAIGLVLVWALRSRRPKAAAPSQRVSADLPSEA